MPATPVPTRSTPRPDDPWAGRSRLLSVQESVVKVFLFLCAAVTVLTTAGIVLVLGVEAVRFFQQPGISLSGFLSQSPGFAYGRGPCRNVTVRASQAVNPHQDRAPPPTRLGDGNARRLR